MALIPVTIYGSSFTNAEVIFLQSIADHSYTNGQLIIGNSATGGISFNTITAGSGITVTNGNGTIQIAATGGGFTVLTATETPNGVLKVFTFSAATGQPTFLLVDNAIVPAVNKDTTINWTWNGGTTQATLSAGSVAPLNDIRAIQ